jgi:hypothetical protein
MKVPAHESIRGKRRVNASTPNALRGRLTEKYVGHAGIHGIGVRMHDEKPVIYVYIKPEQAAQESVVRELRNDARPYEVVVVRAEIPTATAHRSPKLLPVRVQR